MCNCPTRTGNGGKNPEGSPVASLAWCVNHLHKRGRALKAGELVIGGAMCTLPELVCYGHCNWGRKNGHSSMCVGPVRQIALVTPPS